MKERTSPKKIYHYALKSTDEFSPSDNYEIVIVPVSAHQLEDVLNSLVSLSKTATFLIFSANWEGTEGIDRILPRDHYLLGGWS